LAKSASERVRPVDLVDHHEVEPAGADVSQQPLQGGALERAAREPAIVVAGGSAVQPSWRWLRM
jgi:hypothetical protein